MPFKLTRRCSACGHRKPHAEFYLRKGKPGGYCIQCSKTKALEWGRRKKDSELGYAVAQSRRDRRRLFDKIAKGDSNRVGKKTCRRCLKVKPQEEFYKNSRMLDSYCIFCRLEVDKELSARSVAGRFKSLLAAARTRSKIASRPFNLTKAFLIELWERQRGACYYTGTPMTYVGDRAPTALSIDRVDPSLGYTCDNVVLCCRRINEMKSDLTVQQLMSTCSQILEVLTCKEETSWLNFRNGSHTNGMCNQGLLTVEKLAPNFRKDVGASGELLEPSARDGGGNQQPSYGKRISTVEGSETRAVSSASNNRPHERPTPLN